MRLGIRRGTKSCEGKFTLAQCVTDPQSPPPSQTPAPHAATHTAPELSSVKINTCCFQEERWKEKNVCYVNSCDVLGAKCKIKSYEIYEDLDMSSLKFRFILLISRYILLF